MSNKQIVEDHNGYYTPDIGEDEDGWKIIQFTGQMLKNQLESYPVDLGDYKVFINGKACMNMRLNIKKKRIELESIDYKSGK